VSANLLAAESDASGAFNIGRGEQVSVIDIVDVLAPHAQNGFEPEFQPERQGEVRHIALDASRAQQELGWKSDVNLVDGLEQTLSSLR
jgi:UDP-glucose 4-epimerase